MSEKILNSIEEQIIISFTGKINILNSENKQILGAILISEGQMINAKYMGIEGVKAFYNACIDEYLEQKSVEIVVEPEIIDLRERKINTPFEALKRKMFDIVSKYKEAQKHRPPNNLKIILLPSFITSEESVTATEFSLMCTLSDYSLVSEIYKFSPLLDYEITNSLVSLRRKNALKVVQVK